MFKFLTVATLSLTALSAVTGLAIPVRRDEASYDQAYLEPYADYSERYTQLNCASQHDTQFFTDCCHPMLKGQTLQADRKPYCIPSTGSSASAAPATSAVNNAAPPPPSFAPSPTSVKPTPTQPAASAPSPTNTGKATYFYQHNTAGACGTVHQDTDFVVALDSAIYDGGKYCGKQVRLVNLDSGASTVATVADECPTCVSAFSVDLSEATFKALSGNNLGLGEFNLGWSFIEN